MRTISNRLGSELVVGSMCRMVVGSPITGAILERIRTFDEGVGLVTPVIVLTGHTEEEEK